MDTYPYAPIQNFFVLPDDGLGPILDPLASAAKTLDIYVYKLTNEPIMAALAAAVERGVQVRAILDRAATQDPDAVHAAHHALHEMGVLVRWAPDYFVKSHAKCFVVDDSFALVGSANFIAGWQDKRDHGVTTTDPTIVQAIAAVFQADWEQRPLLEAPPPALAISPFTSRTTLLDLIASAHSEIVVEHEQFSDDEVVARLAERSRQGVAVRLVLQDDERNRSAVDHLLKPAPGVSIAYPQQHDIHAKLLTVDRRIMLVGSINLTEESLDRRREVALLVDDAAAIGRALAVAQQDGAG
jgi:cardiolipin synthase